MYNIQKAVSRLDFAPKPIEIQITDIRRGVGFFTPRADRPVSLSVLKAALKKAGYTLDRAEINIVGTLERDGEKWVLVATQSNQRFVLEGADVEKILEGATARTRVEIAGEWKTVGAGTSERESISPRTVKKAVVSSADRKATTADSFGEPSVRFIPASYDLALSKSLTESRRDSSTLIPITMLLAPIRTTTPGLTVYKGGAMVPRLYFIKQHFGNLDVSRQRLQLSVSYTPSQRLQLETEVPFSRTSFDDGVTSGSGFGLGNATLWSKYRFFRTVKTFGDRQASARFGLELPTGKKKAPNAARVNAPAFVRQQLTSINGGLSAHFDVAYSQARHRAVFGANAEGILRSERDGFRIGNELRVNTDLEYVLLPLKYESPGGELFLILETTFVHRGLGRLNGNVVPDSRSTEFYLAPGLQYAVAPLRLLS